MTIQEALSNIQKVLDGAAKNGGIYGNLETAGTVSQSFAKVRDCISTLGQECSDLHSLIKKHEELIVSLRGQLIKQEGG